MICHRCITEFARKRENMDFLSLSHLYLVYLILIFFADVIKMRDDLCPCQYQESVLLYCHVNQFIPDQY